MFRKTLIILALGSLPTILAAQISRGGYPLRIVEKKSSVPPFHLSEDYIRESILEVSGQEGFLDGKKPMTIAVDQPVELNPLNSGQWNGLPNGSRVWTLQIYSKGAEGLAVYFDNFQLEEGSMLFLYDPELRNVIGGLNHLNNKKNGKLQSAFVPGDQMTIELQVPEGRSPGELSIGSVSHAFVNIFGDRSQKDGYYGKSGSCEVDVNCDEGLAWQTIKRSVCRIIFKRDAFRSEICTGTLINNTARDQKALLYTANHCISNDFEAGSAVIYFGYESPDCEGQDGIVSMTISSADLLATSDSLDFSLLLLSDTPPDSYQPFYAGWSRLPVPPLSSVTIHHPSGDVKKISRDENPAVVEYQDKNPPSWLFFGSIEQAFWRIVNWEVGATEAGSSGSPLFNQVKLIVGNLTGGDASCLYPVNDYFSKFHMNWDYYSMPEKQLKHWLDSLGTGEEYIVGLDPFDTPDGIQIELFQVYSNPGTGLFTIHTDTFSLDEVRIRIFNVNGAILADHKAINLPDVQLDISSLPNGVYFMDIQIREYSERKKIILLK